MSAEERVGEEVWGAFVCVVGEPTGADVVGVVGVPDTGSTSISEHELYQNSVKSQYQSKVYFPGGVSAGIMIRWSVFSYPSAFVYQ